MGITPREQLKLCVIQDFPDCSCMISGTEMEEWHGSLMPEGPRHTRAKSHIVIDNVKTMFKTVKLSSHKVKGARWTCY
jgi:hypothetical protein